MKVAFLIFWPGMDPGKWNQDNRGTRDKGMKWRMLRASVLLHTQVITKPGFVCFTASSIFLIQKAACVIKHPEERK